MIVGATFLNKNVLKCHSGCIQKKKKKKKKKKKEKNRRIGRTKTQACEDIKAASETESGNRGREREQRKKERREDGADEEGPVRVPTSNLHRPPTCRRASCRATPARGLVQGEPSRE